MPNMNVEEKINIEGERGGGGKREKRFVSSSSKYVCIMYICVYIMYIYIYIYVYNVYIHI